MTSLSKSTVSLDFDGVIHSYHSPWTTAEEIPDPPVVGAINKIREYLDAGLQVEILSIRAKTVEGINAIRRYLEFYGLERRYSIELEISSHKSPAILYIDDRGYHFTGEFPSVEFIRSFKPWNRQ